MKKILIVDDDEDIVDAVKAILTSHGFNVYSHSTSFNVADVVRDYHPNLILLDIRLFGKSGIQICRELKLKHTLPIILFSADTEQGKKYLECNADDFIQKPFNVDEFINTINSHLN